MEYVMMKLTGITNSLKLVLKAAVFMMLAAPAASLAYTYDELLPDYISTYQELRVGGGEYLYNYHKNPANAVTGANFPTTWQTLRQGQDLRLKILLPPGVDFAGASVEAVSMVANFGVCDGTPATCDAPRSSPPMLLPSGSATLTAPKVVSLVVSAKGAEFTFVTLSIVMHVADIARYEEWRKQRNWAGATAGDCDGMGGAYCSGTSSSCTQTLSANAVNAAATNGQYSVTVTPSATACESWSASTTYSWIHLGKTSGTGTETLNFTVDANTDVNSRTGTITIAGQTYTVTQAGAPACTTTLDKYKVEAPAAFDVITTGKYIVDITSNCGAWKAESKVDWITVDPAAASGTDTGKTGFTVAANSGAAPRKGTLTIAGQTLVVIQAAAATVPACRLTLSSPAVSAAAAGKNSVSVTPSCGEWLAASNASWITVDAGSESGKVAGTVNLSVAANSGTPRSGTLTIAGQTFQTVTVTQAGGTTADCVFDWAENAYPGLFSARPLSQITSGGLFYYRYYSATKSYLVVSPAGFLPLSGQKFYYYGPTFVSGGADQLFDLGNIGTWSTQITPKCL